jgi:hypothetical protein
VGLAGGTDDSHKGLHFGLYAWHGYSDPCGVGHCQPGGVARPEVLMSKGYSEEVEHVHCYPTVTQYRKWQECADREQRSMSGLIKVARERYVLWQESILFGDADKGGDNGGERLGE